MKFQLALVFLSLISYASLAPIEKADANAITMGEDDMMNKRHYSDSYGSSSYSDSDSYGSDSYSDSDSYGSSSYSDSDSYGSDSYSHSNSYSSSDSDSYSDSY
jgi:hypothetical protein